MKQDVKLHFLKIF